jgi:hypothetical protein
LAVCWANSESGAGRLLEKFGGAVPVRSIDLIIITLARTFLGHPYCTAAAAITRVTPIELVEQGDDVPPRQSSDRLVDNRVLIPRRSQSSHVLQAAPRQFGHVGNSARRSSANRFITPAPQP